MYRIIFHEDVRYDLKILDKSVQIQAFKKLDKIANEPYLGQLLGNKNNLDLSGFRKIYVNSKKIRIIYKIIDKNIEIFVVAVGKREDMEIYKSAAKRV